MIKINLNPDRKKTKVKIKKPGFKVPTIGAPKEGLIYVAVPITVFILEFAYLMFLNIEMKKLEQKKQQLMVERTKYRVAKKQIDVLKQKIKEAEKMKDEVTLKINIYNKLAKEKADFGNILYSISRSVPDGIWLTNLDISRNQTKLKGYTFDPQYISIFYQNLKKYYGDIVFKSTQMNKRKMLTYYSFDFNMKNWKKSEKSPKN
jgi:type IV pilus assembly protein PilN